MATVKAIKQGMKGDDVANLQTTLNNLGYNLDVDGSFGPQTLAAVKDYQKSSGLTVDGMVGPQTTAALASAGSSKPAAGTTPSETPSAAPKVDAPDILSIIPNVGAAAAMTTPKTEQVAGTPNVLGAPKDSGHAPINYPDAFSYENFTYDDYKSSGAVDKATANPFSYDAFSYGDYQESETVKQANAALNAILAAQPGAYQSKWQGQIDDIIGRILNREKFTYDVNSDALYQQYAEQYQRLGKLAMQDTMGQAAAMTGGYGSSYAQSVGQQAYQGYLAQLNEMIPELYGMALDQYNREGQEMYNQYGLLSDQEAQEYGRYQDSYNQWLAERDYATGRYDSERNFDYGKYTDNRNFAYGQHSDDRNLAYNEYVNAIELAKWQETDAYNKYLNDRNFAYGAYSDDRNLAYDEYLNEIQKAQWGAQFDENVKQNAIGNEQWDKSFGETQKQNAIGNQQWQQSFDENVKQNAIGNEQWDKSFGETQKQNAIGNQQWETSRQDGLNSEAKAYARDDVMSVISAGGTPTDAQLKAAGMTKEVADAVKVISSATNSSSSVAEEAALKHVGTMSSKDIIDTLEFYAADGNNTAIEALLDDAFMTERIDEATYLDWKKKYLRTNSHAMTDTTVATPPPKAMGGGSGLNMVYN